MHTMFTLTAAATTRIRQAAAEGGAELAVLRVAARRERDGSITYGMGFDEPHEGERPALQSDGVTVLIAAPSKPLLEHTELDFVEMEPGQFGFVFVPGSAPTRGTGGCGSCAGGGCGTC
jgi:Fe-S cluster assembly iron-binding protein IscA